MYLYRTSIALHSRAPIYTAPIALRKMSTSETTSIDSSHEISPPSLFRFVITRSFLDGEIIDHNYHGKGTVEEPYIVSWLPNDTRNPFNFGPSRRWLITILAAISCFSISFTSSAYAGGVDSIMEEFGVPETIGQLGISLFVLGFALGPLIWGPLSEVFGRQPVFIGTFGGLVLFNALSASAKSMAQLLVFRALAGETIRTDSFIFCTACANFSTTGIVGSSPLSNAGALIADIFPANERGLAIGLFSFGPFMGPVIGPIVGGYLGATGPGWRAVLWLCTGLCGILFLTCTLLTPETFAPVLLDRRATSLSKLTGKVYVSTLNHGIPIKTPSSAIRDGLTRPWALLLLEPIVMLLSVYIAIVYATMYMLFAAYPIIFRAQRGWSAGQSGLAFTAMAIGMIAAMAYTVYDNERYRKHAAAQPGGRAPPEARLPLCMAGGCLVPIGLFWFAWTNSPSVHWIVCLLGTTVFGAGNVLLYLSCINYLVDSYVIYTASCMAGSSVLRSVLGAAFPLFTGTMYRNLGIHWASSVPAFMALVCVPFPFVFAKYGATIRKHCRYAARAQALVDMMAEKQPPSPRASEPLRGDVKVTSV